MFLKSHVSWKLDSVFEKCFFYLFEVTNNTQKHQGVVFSPSFCMTQVRRHRICYPI